MSAQNDRTSTSSKEFLVLLYLRIVILKFMFTRNQYTCNSLPK